MMAEIKTLALDKILMGDRLRPIDDDHAFLIGQSIAATGLLNPITVRATPRAARPWTLVAGGHRLRGHELHGLTTIDCMVVKKSGPEAQLAEIEENVFRNELSKLDRALFVLRWRELWEEQNGKIAAGGDMRSADHSIKLTEWSAEGRSSFYEHVADRLGLSRPAIERAQFLGQRLHVDLRRAVRPTPVADNQSMLLTLARFEPKRQQAIAIAFADCRNILQAIDLTDPNAAARERLTIAQRRVEAVRTNFKALDSERRRSLLADLLAAYPDDADWALSQPRAANVA